MGFSLSPTVQVKEFDKTLTVPGLSLIHISEPTRLDARSRMPSSA